MRRSEHLTYCMYISFLVPLVIFLPQLNVRYWLRINSTRTVINYFAKNGAGYSNAVKRYPTQVLRLDACHVTMTGKSDRCMLNDLFYYQVQSINRLFAATAENT